MAISDTTTARRPKGPKTAAEGTRSKTPARGVGAVDGEDLFETIARMGHEQVVLCNDSSAGYRGIIAIHSTTLGPALGGTRFWAYGSDREAITDALRLARGMTYKNAVAGLNLGGGKAVIIGDNRTPHREMLFRAHGRFVESLGGRYVTAEDVGTSPADMDFVHMETDYVAGLAGRSGDPSPVTAHGVFRAIQQADVFAPCALGGIINDETIPRLTVEIVAGGANNQLLEERHGDMLEERGILYAPDYVANAGGVINVYSELAGWDAARSLRKADEIYDTVLGVFEIARADGAPTYVAADRLAERRLHSVGSLVRTWPQWPNK